ncbi:DedA family protein [Saccharopolyspora sp. CA-218241]|uniref:DedA family protein n=1 Tax=Saccharopolyspora sp. CA-218241 TaxID=3240027 RepID=UPI003D979C10
MSRSAAATTVGRVVEWIGRLDAFLTDLVASAAALDPWACAAALCAVIALEASLFVGLVVPGEAVLLLGAIALGPRWAPLVVAASALGSLLGQVGGYWLGRGLGPGLRGSRVGRAIGAARWETAEAVVRDTGGRALITLRFVAVVHSLVPAVIGSLRMPFARFLLPAVIGSLLWASVHTTASLLLGQAAEAIGYGWAAAVVTGAGVVAAGVLLVRALRRQRAARRTPVG